MMLDTNLDTKTKITTHSLSPIIMIKKCIKYYLAQTHDMLQNNYGP
jgi:hypothetical protein